MRKPRLEFPGAWYHVIARGNQRQRVFLDDGDHVRYLKVAGDNFRRNGFKLFAYCLMPNHVHLLVRQVTAFPLSRVMQRIQSAYTNFFSKKHDKPGHLFQGRYKAILVDEDRYLKELVRYIHLNPWRAKLEASFGKYPWSSHRQYLGKERDALAPVEARPVLRMFSRIGPVSKKAYLKFVAEGMDQGHREDLYDLRDGRVLGDEEFEKDTYESAKSSQKAGLKLNRTIGDLWKALLDREGLRNEPTGRQRSHLMREAAYWAIEAAGLRRKDVARYFDVDPSAITRVLKRLETQWEAEPRLKQNSERWARSL